MGQCADSLCEKPEIMTRIWGTCWTCCEGEQLQSVENICHLFQSFVIDKAGGILWDLELPLLYLFAELPGRTRWETKCQEP